MDNITHKPEPDNQSEKHRAPSRIQSASFVFIATIVAQFISLAWGRTDETHALASTLLPSLLFLSALTIPCCLIGSFLGPRVSLGGPGITDIISRKSLTFKDMMPAIALSIGVGCFLLLLRVWARPYLPEELPSFGHRGIVGGLAVSIGAAVAEEVWFRFGLMTLIVWGATKLLGNKVSRPVILWGVILLSATAFGAAHLPQLISYGAGSPIAIFATILGNVLVGTLYGWCFWKRGLLIAIMSHFTVDLVLHVLPALA